MKPTYRKKSKAHSFYPHKSYTAIIKQNDQWWIGWIEEVPGVDCQEATKKELLESLQETLREALAFK